MRKVLAGAVIVAIGGVLAVVLIDRDANQPGPGPSLQQKLTATERAEARRLVSDSADLRRILGDRRYEVESIGVWSRYVARRYREALGSLTPVRVSVDPPGTVRAQWPYIAESEPCERQWVPLTVKDLREIYAWVDLAQSVVAAIVPSESGGLGDWDVPARADSPCSA